MPRLIAIEGPEAGVALPVSGAATYIAAGPDGRLKLLRGGEAPPLGARIERLEPPRSKAPGGEYRIAPLEPHRGAVRLFVNGSEVSEGSTLNHGDLITFAGATLIFDREDHGDSQTAPVSGAGPAGAAGGRDAAELKTDRVVTPQPPDRDDEPRDAGGPPSDPAEPPLLTDSVLYRRKVFHSADDVLREVANEPRAAEASRLATLLKVAATLGATLDLPELLTALLDLVFDAVPAARGTILLFDRPTRKLRSMIGKVRGRGAVEGAQVPVSRTIIREALRTREAILTLDAQSDMRFAEGESIAAANMRSVACVPIVRQDRVLGAIHLDTGARARHFDKDDIELLTAIAAIAALALENARLFLEQAERERLRAELQLATGIQQRLLPKAPPAVRGLSVYGHMRPALELGGDLYDFVLGDDGSLHVLCGDVSGKGVGASLVMAMARSYFRPLARSARGRGAGKALVAEMSRLLYHDTDHQIFMSAVYLRWDPGSPTLLYCGAGQEHLVVYRAATGTCESFPAGGLALAVVEDASSYLAEKELRLEPGDAVVLYTDGISEQRDPGGSFFELARVKEAVAAVGARPEAEGVVAGVFEAVSRFAGDAEQHDDMTVVALKRL